MVHFAVTCQLAKLHHHHHHHHHHYNLPLPPLSPSLSRVCIDEKLRRQLDLERYYVTKIVKKLGLHCKMFPVFMTSKQTRMKYERFATLLNVHKYVEFSETRTLSIANKRQCSTQTNDLSSIGEDFPCSTYVHNLKSLYSPFRKIENAKQNLQIGVVWGS